MDRTYCPPLDTLKAQAKRLRAGLKANGIEINYAKPLEFLSQKIGYRDWNTLNVAAGNQLPDCPVNIGA